MPQKNINDRLESVLQELHNEDERTVDTDLAEQLADRAMELSTPPEPPQLNEEVGGRERLEARQGLPKDARVELGRVWLPEDVEHQPECHFDEEENVVRLEAPLDLKRANPPKIRYEEVDADEITNHDVDEIADGSRPKHLDVAFNPEFDEDIDRVLPSGADDLPTHVFSPDTRYIFHDTSYPWSMIGRVETSDGACTGTMIGRRLMLTASHCIDWKNGSAGYVKFSPAYYNGPSFFGQAWGEKVIYYKKASGSLSDQETAFDYVVVVLDRNMGDNTGYAGYRRYRSYWNHEKYWQHIGYPADLTSTQRPAFYGGGAITSALGRVHKGTGGYVLGHFMDIVGGHSGGPVWGWWGTEEFPRVVGVQSAEASTPSKTLFGDNEAGGGRGLSNIIGYARKKHS